MTDSELLARVKKSLGVTGNFNNDTLLNYILEVKQYMKAAGVPISVVNNELSVGVITRGVADLWNYGAGTTNLSPYFRERIIQLTLTDPIIEEE